MSDEVVFLLEELSMKALLEVLLPRVAPNLPFVLVAHEGKRDLAKSIPRKLKAWRTPGARFIVVHDQDRADCRALKRNLQETVPPARRKDTFVRIACRELEYVDPRRPQGGGDRVRNTGDHESPPHEKFRDPDRLCQPRRRAEEADSSLSKGKWRPTGGRAHRPHAKRIP